MGERAKMPMNKSRFARNIFIVLIALTTVVTLAPLLVPYQPIADAVSPQQLADSASEFIAVKGVTLHYKRTGQGEPVFILLHGTLLNTYTWHEVIGPLAEMGTVIAYDRPPFGLASRPMPGEWNGESPYGYEAQTDLLVGLMEALNIRQAILVGNSMGGSIAALTAQRYPERVQALVLAAPAQTIHGVSAPARWLAATPQMRRLGPLFLQGQADKFGMDLYARSWHDPSKIQSNDLESYRQLLHIQNWDRSLWKLIVAAKPFETLLHFEAITSPTLIITGDDDRVMGTDTNSRLANKMPNARLVVLSGCGHVSQEECPGAFMDAVSQWLAQSYSSSAPQR